MYEYVLKSPRAKTFFKNNTTRYVVHIKKVRSCCTLLILGDDV